MTASGFMSTPTARRPRSLHSTSVVPEPIIWSRHKLTGRRVAKNEVTRDVWRPVAPVIPDVCCPVAAVGEAPDGGGFGGEGGGGELRDLPVGVEFYFCFPDFHFRVGLEELFVVGPYDLVQGSILIYLLIYKLI